MRVQTKPTVKRSIHQNKAGLGGKGGREDTTTVEYNLSPVSLAHLNDFSLQARDPPLASVGGHAHVHRLGREIAVAHVWERLHHTLAAERVYNANRQQKEKTARTHTRTREVRGAGDACTSDLKKEYGCYHTTYHTTQPCIITVKKY